MRFINDRVFERQFEKITFKLREKVRDRLHMLVANEFDPLLNNHKLGPPYQEYRSINITGDLRLVYRRIGADSYYLRAVGTHHQLYGS